MLNVPTPLTQQFSDALEKVSGRVHIATSLEGAIALVLALLKENDTRVFAVGAIPEELDRALCNYARESQCEMLGPKYEAVELPMKMDPAQVGISLADFGIAESGTVVEVAVNDAHRLVSAMPRRHIALLYARDLVPTLRSASARMREIFDANPGGIAVSFISGPSRTGDIEMILTLGVHGPAAADVILIGETENL
jgi:L-lactate dehydrogenase complex protein LldG